ncbi:MAG: TlpA family protein disulfide reductase [Rubripirellula sp.]
MSDNVVKQSRIGWPRKSVQIAIASFLVACSLSGSAIAQDDARDPQTTNTPDDPDAQAVRVGLGELTLINGNRVLGSLMPSDNAERIAWQSTSFASPFRFRMESVESIKFPLAGPQVGKQGAFAVEMVNGDVIHGDILKWTPEAVSMLAEPFGRIEVRTNAISRLYRVEENPTLVFAGLDGLRAWVLQNSSGWQEDGDHLWTSQTGATLNGNLNVPLRAIIELQLSWSTRPNFVFAAGTDTRNEIDSVTDGWRMETYGGKLALVKESETLADVATIADLTLRKNIRLVLYLDQKAGTLQVFKSDGGMLGQIALDLGHPTTRDAIEHRGVRLINRGNDLRLERLRISRWMGSVPEKLIPGAATIAFSDGSFVTGNILGMDAGSEKLRMRTNNVDSEVDWKRVIGIKPASTEPPSEPAKCAIFLTDGVRLSGELVSVDDANWTLNGQNLSDPVKVPLASVRSLVVFDHDAVDVNNVGPAGRLGRLEVDDRKLTGRLVAAKEADEEKGSVLHWHPFGSSNSAALNRSIAGRITYRDQAKVDTSSAAARALAMQRLRLQQQKRGLNFGQLFLKRADQQKTGEVKRDAHVVHVRTGDVINCRIESIDERGVHLSTLENDDAFVSHENMKAIEFVANSPPPDVLAAKRERLLTIPRLQKTAPPTHLLCSHNGDFLRCRLLSVDEETIRAEVQLEELEMPRSRVAQIVWFHPEESAAEQVVELPSDVNPDSAVSRSTPPSPFADRVQVVKRDGRRVTFRATEVTDREIIGESTFVGRCSFKIDDVDQLVIGEQIAEEVSELAYSKWKLQPAVEPLVTAAMEGNALPAGTESTLIGKPAPEVSLMLLDGNPFRLSESQGTIVVLDFWATWCAPCMQTMPLVEAAIAEYDPERVRLVSINLEEPAEQIRSVLERHDMNLTVALDRDGVAAQRYQARAIPQLVVVGPDGTVERLFVGGGSGVVEQMKAALDELLKVPAS